MPLYSDLLTSPDVKSAKVTHVPLRCLFSASQSCLNLKTTTANITSLRTSHNPNPLVRTHVMLIMIVYGSRQCIKRCNTDSIIFLRTTHHQIGGDPLFRFEGFNLPSAFLILIFSPSVALATWYCEVPISSLVTSEHKQITDNCFKRREVNKANKSIAT